MSLEGVPSKIVSASDRRQQDVMAFAIYFGLLALNMIVGFISVGNARNPADILKESKSCSDSAVILNRFAGESGAAGRRLDSGDDDISDLSGFSLMGEAPEGVVLGVLVTILLGFLWLYLLKNHTRAMVWGTIYSTMAIMLIPAVMAMIGGSVAAGVIILVFVGIYALFIYCVRSSIDLSADLLELAVTAMKEYPSLLATDAVTLLGTLALMVMFIVFIACANTAGIVQMHESGGIYSCEFQTDGLSSLTQILSALMLSWTLMIGKQVAQFTAAFVAGEWYFKAPEQRSDKPAWIGLRLALSKSFGSLAVAGLILAAVEYIRSQARKMRRSGNILSCILSCIIEFFLNLISFLTNFATIVTAVTGDSFVTSAKRGSKVLKGAFVDGFISDRMSKRVLFFGACVLGFLSAVLSWVLMDGTLGTNSLKEYGALVIVVLLLVLLGVPGALLAAVLAAFIRGPVAIPFVAAFIGALGCALAMFLAEVLIDLTASMFVFYAIDRFNQVQSFNSSAKLTSGVERMAASCGAIKANPETGGAAPTVGDGK